MKEERYNKIQMNIKKLWKELKKKNQKKWKDIKLNQNIELIYKNTKLNNNIFIQQ